MPFSENLPSGTVGQPFSYSFQQSTAESWFLNFYGPPVFPPYYFFASGIVPLPTGMSIDPNGVFHGIPASAGLFGIFSELHDSYPGPVPPYRAIINAGIAVWRVKAAFVGGRVRRTKFTPAPGNQGNRTYGF